MGSVVYGCTKLVIAQLYPAYASFKAVKNRNVKVGNILMKSFCKVILY